MEADWDEIARVPFFPSGQQLPPTPPTTLGFDPDQELLWAGNEYGRISSHYSRELSRYTSAKAHPNEGPVRQLLFQDRGVISLASRSVHLTIRRGLHQWHITHPDFHDLRCMSFTKSEFKILVAGLQESMFVIDIEKGQIVESVATDWNYTIMRKSRYICAATDDGSVNILDPSTFQILKSWKSHGSAINDMDAHNDFLVTCGYSVRHGGPPTADNLANVYDLKQLKPIAPIPFPAGAALVRMLPNMQTTAILASQTGQLQLLDLMDPNAVNLRQVNITGYMLTMDVAQSGQALAYADSDNYIVLWGSPSKLRFSIKNKETEFQSPDTPLIHVNWTDDPLSMVGLPYYTEKLLSAWPSDMIFEVGAPPSPVDPTISQLLQPINGGGGGGGHWANTRALPRKKHRYQAENKRVTLPSENALAAPKFLSEKAREPSPAAHLGRRVSAAAEALAGASIAVTDEEDLLLKYSNVEIKYSKFGVEDFDFKFYNKTVFSGLETHIANSFTNSLLQLFKFTPLVRNLALKHAATSCIYDQCLLCEMGFLFDMLDKANGQNCQATNLLKSFSSHREAAHLGLFEENLATKSLSATIQAVNRFFLTQVSSEWQKTYDERRFQVIPEDDHFLADQVLVTAAAEAIRCMYCRTETVKRGDVLVHELIYPSPDHKHSSRSPRFSQLLKASIERETQSRGWCNKCRRYQQHALRRTVQQMPLVMMINAALNNSAYRHLWATPGWLPEEIGILVDGGHVFCFEGDDLRLRVRSSPDLILYDLVGFVSEIDIHEHQKPHLVSFINVNISSRDLETSANSQWHLFNDFLVAEVRKEEAMTFAGSWKMPCVLAYQVQTARHSVDDSWKDNLDTTLLYFEWSMNNRQPVDSCHVLDSNLETPAPGTHIALDTEFVDLEKAEIDVKADGTQETIRPSKSGLARVSVLRGSGDNEGVPFIDDYIEIKDTIVDYVTQYSGIRPGDLDPRTSTKNLVPLKVAYKKLWVLLNLGCTFVGHGLASDFRKINIKVPKEQTVDTQYLFFHPGKNRRLSLRYLAWAVLKEYIQEDGGEEEGHDSIEDARMALRLWKKFSEFEDAGIVNQMLEEIFREGVKVGFKPPPRKKDGEIGTPGRNTPDMMGRSAPGTPSRGFRLSAGPSGGTLNPAGETFRPGSGLGQFGSPLR